MQMKNPTWQSMTVLNVWDLNQEQSDALSVTDDLVSKETFRPLAQLNSGPARIQIDEASAKHCRCRLLLQPASFWFESRD